MNRRERSQVAEMKRLFPGYPLCPECNIHPKNAHTHQWQEGDRLTYERVLERVTVERVTEEKVTEIVTGPAEELEARLKSLPSGVQATRRAGLFGRGRGR